VTGEEDVVNSIMDLGPSQILRLMAGEDVILQGSWCGDASGLWGDRAQQQVVSKGFYGTVVHAFLETGLGRVSGAWTPVAVMFEGCL
jgi:hypothetical protein